MRPDREPVMFVLIGWSLIAMAVVAAIRVAGAVMDAGVFLQVVACGTTLAATWLVGNKRAAGPALSVAAALCFALVNAYAGLWLCSAFSATMAVMNARNFFRWRRDAAKEAV